MNDLKNWRSVRKIRYCSDIIAGINYVVDHKNKTFNENILAEYIIKERTKRINMINRHYKKISPRTRKSLYNTRFKITMPDTLAFFKNINLLNIKDNQVISSIISNYYEKNGLKRLSEILVKNILESKYVAYKNFLKLLIQIKKFYIPNNLKKRDANFREYLTEKGFLTDVVSFYAIRDLFYELYLINWYEDKNKNILIYPIASYNENLEVWNNYISINNEILYFNKLITGKKFITSLVNSYLTDVNDRYNLEGNLINIRDEVCYNLKISDKAFSKYLVKAYKFEKAYKITLNYGTIKSRKNNYGLKILNFPKISEQQLALYIRIQRDDK